MPWQVENKWQDDGNGNQEDHNPLEQLQTPSGRLVGDFVVDAFQDVQLVQNARIPLFQMKALRGQAVYAGQVLIAQEFEGVIPTASFNSLSNVRVLQGIVTDPSWLTEGTLRWSWTHVLRLLK